MSSAPARERQDAREILRAGLEDFDATEIQREQNGEPRNYVAERMQGYMLDARDALLVSEHALIGEAFTARMCGDHPDLHPDAVKAYRWAEAQFTRIAKWEVDERDLIG